ncbi:hypothetical protein [Demequina phytophila]|uniref:hypothetical protein n=1 Tax=Demequina phytophila TaxID=1638981 RepID=UPI000784725F|nr:hypothetical protein [Demequina phytophila]
MSRGWWTAGAAALAVGAWVVARSLLGGVPEAEEPPADPEASAIGVAGLEPVAYACIGGGWYEDARTYELLMVETVTSGWLDTCMEVFRVPDEDDSADYFHAAATAYWTTEGGWSASPWAAIDAPPLGPETIAIHVSEPSVDNVFLADSAALEPCADGEEPAYPGLGWVLSGGCAVDADIEQVIDGDVASWTMAEPSALDVTVHTLEVKVAQGATPTFTLVTSSAAGESRAEVRTDVG